jgi:hypothetical protein
MYAIDVGSVWSGSIASNTAQPYRLWCSSYPKFKLLTSKSLTNEAQGIRVRTGPGAHPQHMKVLKHLATLHMYEMWDLFGVGP